MLYSDKMVKIEDIVFWIIIMAIIAIAIWMLFGSPTLEAGLISIGLFVAGSEILLWKTLFKMDKKTPIGFIKVQNKFESIENKLNKIEKRLK